MEPVHAQPSPPERLNPDQQQSRRRLEELTPDFAALFSQELLQRPLFFDPASAAPAPASAPPQSLTPDVREPAQPSTWTESDSNEENHRTTEESKQTASKAMPVQTEAPPASDEKPGLQEVSAQEESPRSASGSEAASPNSEVQRATESGEGLNLAKTPKPAPAQVDLPPQNGAQEGTQALAEAVLEIQEAESSAELEAKSAKRPAITQESSSPGPVKTASPIAETSTAPTDAVDTDFDMRKAMALEDRLLEEEMQQQEQLRRQRALDEARLQSLSDDRKAGVARLGGSFGGHLGSGAGHSGGQPDGRSSQSSASGKLGHTSAVSFALPGEAALAGQLSRVGQEGQVRAPNSSARALAFEAMEQVRKIADQRKPGEKVNLTIRIDDVTEVKVRITPKGDGTHELAFLVADPRLKEELERARPEIRAAATELPIDIADVLIGDIENPVEDLRSLEPDLAYEGALV